MVDEATNMTSQPPFTLLSIEAAGFSISTRRKLRRIGILTLEDLCTCTEEYLTKDLKCFGWGSFDEVREVLERFGLSLLGEGLPPATPDLIVQFKLFLTAPSEYTHFKLAVLDLCLNIANQLRVAGFVTVRDLLDTNRHALSRQHGFTSSMISEIEERIELYGLALQPSPKIVTKTGAIHHVLTR